MKMNNKVYDWLTFVVQIILPGVALIYIVVGSIWSWPFIKEVAATCAALATIFGAILGLSRLYYNKNGNRFDGDILVTKGEDDQILYTLALNRDAGEFKNDKSIVFRVVNKIPK